MLFIMISKASQQELARMTCASRVFACNLVLQLRHSSGAGYLIQTQLRTPHPDGNAAMSFARLAMQPEGMAGEHVPLLVDCPAVMAARRQTI